MDKAGLQENFLRNLARIGSPAAEKAISEKIDAIAEQLASASRYDNLEQQLEQLEEIGFREAGKTIRIVKQFLDRINGLDLKYDAHHQDSANYIRKFATKERLIIKALGVLDRIRYYEISNIAEIYAQHLSNADNEISKKASECLNHLAEFDINIYYAGENRAGLGPAPQMQIIKWLETLPANEMQRKFAATAQLCKCLLSSEMSGTSSDYMTVTLSTGAIPATKEIRELRVRSLILLVKLYGKASTIAEKKSAINSMLNATRIPHIKHSDDVIQMISENTVQVLDFFKQIIPDENLQIVQKIEHETFWRFYHSPTDEVSAAALEIRDLLKEQHEYQIYRDLIGFEGVFEDWENRLSNKRHFAAEEEQRTRKALEYADEINNENWEEWRERILRFCQTESDDLATFPHFYEFLNRLATKSPDIALELVRNQAHEIDPFVIPIFRGLWNGARKDEFRAQVLEWIEADKWLVAIAKVFFWEEVEDKKILGVLTAKAINESLHDVLVMLVSAALRKYEEGRATVMHEVFLPAVEELTAMGSASWVFNFWHRKDRKSLIADLDVSGREVVLENLILVEKIDYHVEGFLIPFAGADPAGLLTFFRDRQVFEEKAMEQGEYEAIPYRFHSLNETLSQFPDIAIDTVRSWFDGSDPLFQYRGARLLHCIFPDFPKPFEDKLLEFVKTGEEENLKFVLSILRNYEGEPFLHGICREIVAVDPDQDELLSEVTLVLYSTGVVSGEFGLAEAWEKRADQIKHWLRDENEAVRSFAAEKVAMFEEAAKAERRRAEENIELRKHEFGVRDEPGASNGDDPS